AQRARLDGRTRVDVADLPPTLTARTARAQGAPRDAAGTDSRDGALRKASFSDREIAEIEALCATGFRVGEAEALLGYSGKSRTFSHRLRGLSLKALTCVDYRTDAAAALLTGADPALTPIVERRLRTLLESMAERAHEPADKVLTNLLTEHRRYALQTLAHLRRHR
ncbi:MAG: hypothetical protein WCC48_10905, partial [Anaeromyxobacteraceae bacterium]